MAEESGSVKMIGRLGSLSMGVGFILFLSGLFVFPRGFMLLGIALLVLAVFLFWMEEAGARRARAQAANPR